MNIRILRNNRFFTTHINYVVYYHPETAASRTAAGPAMPCDLAESRKGPACDGNTWHGCVWEEGSPKSNDLYWLIINFPITVIIMCIYIYICVIIIIYTHEIAFFVVCPILRPEEKLQALTGAHWRDVCVLFFLSSVSCPSAPEPGSGRSGNERVLIAKYHQPVSWAWISLAGNLSSSCVPKHTENWCHFGSRRRLVGFNVISPWSIHELPLQNIQLFFRTKLKNGDVINNHQALAARHASGGKACGPIFRGGSGAGANLICTSKAGGNQWGTHHSMGI